MVIRDTHHIPEQSAAYRRGVVLGMTMAEVGILIIFVLLLLIGFRLWDEARAMDGRQTVTIERMQALEEAADALTELKSSLQLSGGETVDEIRSLILAIQEGLTTPEAQTALRDARAAIEEMKRIREEVLKGGGTEALAQQVEQQSFRIANQEGQLQRYESLLKDAGEGKGERPCWVRPDGTIEYLYDIVLGSNGIRMREYQYENRVKERFLLPAPTIDPNEVLSAEEFLRRTKPLYEYSKAENCRFFVVVYDATGVTEKELYKHLLFKVVEGRFYKRVDDGPAPF